MLVAVAVLWLYAESNSYKPLRERRAYDQLRHWCCLQHSIVALVLLCVRGTTAALQLSSSHATHYIRTCT
eukprot:2230-Heterococcus_DN1.PRE.3